MLNLHTGLCLRCCCLRGSTVLAGLHLGALCVFISKLAPWIHTPAGKDLSQFCIDLGEAIRMHKVRWDPVHLLWRHSLLH